MILPQPPSLTATSNVLRAARTHTFHASEAALERFPFDDMERLLANVRGLLETISLDPDGYRPVDPVAFHRILHLLSLAHARLLSRVDPQATLRQGFDQFSGLVLAEVLQNAHRDAGNNWPDLDAETVQGFFVRFTHHWQAAAKLLAEPGLEPALASRTIRYLSQSAVYLAFIAYYLTSIAPVTLSLPLGSPEAPGAELLDETR